MRLFSVLLFFSAFGFFVAQQSLGSGYFIYNNVTVGQNSAIVVGFNTSNAINIVVIRPQDLGEFENETQVPQFYNRTMGSGIYQLNVTPGSYLVIFRALMPTVISSSATAFQSGTGKRVNLNNNYTYNFSLSNYSIVNVTILSESSFNQTPVDVNLSGSLYTISSDANLEFFNITLNRGEYPLSVASHRPTELFVIVSSTPTLVNPFEAIASGSVYPIGVVSYGLYNSSGRTVPYQISSGEMIGIANISSISAQDFNYTIDNVSQYSASLQLNVELKTFVGGLEKTYWLQNVADFNTSNDTLYFVDNIWNNTLPDAALSNSTFIGKGNVTSCDSSCSNQSFYAFSYPNTSISYSFPLSIKFVTVENQTQGGTKISFGYQLLGNGALGLGPVIFYDSVIIPGSYNSTLLVTPYYTTPGGGGFGGNYYDTELVFGGEASGALSTFSRMNSSLWIYYVKNDTVVPFPSSYIFGLSTAESASNLKVSPYKYGGLVTTGTPNLFENILVSNSILAAARYVQNTSKYTTTAMPYTTVPYANPGTGLSNYEPYLIDGLAGVVVVLLIIEIYRLFKR